MFYRSREVILERLLGMNLLMRSLRDGNDAQAMGI